MTEGHYESLTDIEHLQEDLFNVPTKINQLMREHNDDLNSVAQSKKCLVPEKRQHQEYTEVFAWGLDSHGQLGIRNEQSAEGQVFKVPRSCSFNIVIKSVSCGEAHSAILTKLGHLYMVGSNSMG